MSTAAAARFTRQSKVREVVARPDGAEILYRYGFDVGSGFVDTLSQWQSLEQAARTGRLRDLDQLLSELNQSA